MNRFTPTTVLLASVFIASSCSDVGDPIAAEKRMGLPSYAVAPVANVQITPATLQLAVGDSSQMTVTVRDASGNVLTGRTIRWKPTNYFRLRVDPYTGSVTALDGGFWGVIATAEGVVDTAEVTVLHPIPILTGMTPSSVQPGSGEFDLVLTGSRFDVGARLLWNSTELPLIFPADDQARARIPKQYVALAGTAQITMVNPTPGGGVSNALTFRIGSGTNPPPPPSPTPVATVTVTPSSSSLQPGGSVQLTATTLDAQGNTLTGRTIAWSTSNSGVSTVSTAGLVSAASAGSSTITATSEGRTGTAQITVTATAPAPVATVTVSPSNSSLQVGGTVQLIATTRDGSGNVVTGRAIVWSSSNSAVGSVNGSGLVTANSSGNATITATSEARSGTAQVGVSAPPPPPPPPPTGTNPIPDANDLIVIDSRITLQSATNLQEMWSAVLGRSQPNEPTHAGLQTDPWSLAFDIDGRGTNAVRRTWRAYCCGDRDGNGAIEAHMGAFGSAPKEVFIQWRQLLGRTSTGGGIGGIGAFQVHNPADVGHNAGRKNFLVLRDVPGQPWSGSDRFDYLWYGSGGIAVGLGNNVPASTFSPQQQVGTVMLHTLHLRAASRSGAADSREALYVNGVLIKERIGALNEWGFQRTQFPATFRSPAIDMTEYFWDLLIWQPR
ncbi:MAG: Ig-like domain-containing protein [Gemmatimonadota bacterium]